MNASLILRVLGVLLLIVSGFLLLSLPVALYYGEIHLAWVFLVPVGINLLVFAAGRLFAHRPKDTTLSVRSGYLLVALSWLAVTATGALPFVLSGTIPGYTDAFFETMSGFTTTGASILTDVEAVAKSLLFWRSMTHWLGGMGIVVLTVAIFPLLGIGGLRLMDAEAPGPSVDKFTPRVSQTAKILWLLYIGLTLLQVLLLMLGGMGLFDALTHAFGTMATGGFSTRNSSVGHYRNPYLQVVVTVFMLLAGANFTVYYRLLRGRLRSLLQDSELKAYLAVFFVAAAVITVSLNGLLPGSFSEHLRAASFQAASILTTTGFSTENFGHWPHLAQTVLFALMFIGGCAGSTGGGVKVVRLVTLFRQASTELRYLVHPRGIFSVRVSGQTVRKNVIYGAYAFFFLYLGLIFATMVVVATGGYDLITSITAALATLGNIGPGLALVGPKANYAHFPDYITWWLAFVMLAGRLELYTVLLLFTREFWRR